MEEKLPCIIHMPTVAEIYDFACESLQKLPKNFRTHLKDFIIEVKNFPSIQILSELSMTNRYDLLGLYRGVPIPLKKKSNHKEPDVIYLYRAPLIRHALENKEEVKMLVHHVLLNEIAHHLGFTAHEMAWVRQYAKFSAAEQDVLC